MSDKKDSVGKTLMKNASKVAKHVEIVGVSLQQFQAVRELEEFENAEVSFHMETDVENSDSGIGVEVDFTFKVAENDSIVAISRCVHLLTYSIDEDHAKELDAACVEDFGKINGVYNCWPYIREFVQSSLARLSMPELTLPVMTANRIISYYEDQDKEQSEDAKSEVESKGDDSE